MADFTKAFEYMITNEDYSPDDPRYGKVNVDNDGGKVRFGVNSNSLGKNLINTDFYTTMPIDKANTVAMNLYNIHEWASIKGDSITSQRVASKLLDMAVNMGETEASKLCQRAVSVNVDGIIGSITVAAINSMDEGTMLKGLIYWWLWFIQQEINNKPQDKDYEEAWTARAEKLPAA